MYADGTAKRPKKAEFMRFWALQNAADREYLTKQEATDAWVTAGHEALRGMQAESAPASATGASKPPKSRAARQRTPKAASASTAQAGDDSGNDSASSTSSSSSSSGSSDDDEAPAAAARTIRVRAKKPARTVEALPAQAETLLDDAFFAGLGTAEPDIAAADMEFMAEAAPGSNAGSEDEDEEEEEDAGGRGHYRPREWKPGAFVKQREERQYKHAGRYRDSAAARRHTEDTEEADEYAPRQRAGGRQHQQFSDSGRPPARGARGDGPPASAGMKRGRDRAPAQFDRYQPAEARHAAARGASSKRAHMTFDAEAEPSSHRAAARPARPSYGHRAQRDTSATPRTTHFDNFQPPEARHAAARGPAAPRQHMTFD